MMLKKLGYDETVPLEYNNKRLCGVWLIWVGIVIIFSTAFGGKFMLNPFIFLPCYFLGFYLININKKIISLFSQGKSNRFQDRMSIIGVISLFILMFFISGFFFIGFRWRYIWLGVCLATGLHFFFFYYVHGKSMIILGLFCIINSVIGYVLPNADFMWFGISDGIIKLIIGAYLAFLSKPTRAKSYSNREKDLNPSENESL